MSVVEQSGKGVRPAPRNVGGTRDRKWSPGQIAQRWIDAAVIALLTAISLAIYLPYSLKAGWYYDDWAVYAQLRDAGGGWGHQLSVCAAKVPGGRSLACLYDVTEYDLFGAHRSLYHLAVIAFLVLIAGMAYAILKQCRFGWPWAALAAGLLIVSPASDSARLWSIAAIGQAVIALQLAGTLLGLRALRRPKGRARVGLHAAGAALSLLAMVTYEIAVPLVALNIFIYVAALRNRRAFWRGVFDIGLVGLFLIYRVTVSPVSSASGFVVKRPLGAEITRAWVLLRGAWSTWHTVYAPGVLGGLVVIFVLVAGAATAIFVPRARARLTFWGAGFTAAVVTSAVCALTFITANDLYRLDIDGTFNRLNAPATLAYAVGFVSLLGVGYELLRHFAPMRWIAPAVLVVVIVVGSVHQLHISAYHKNSWEVSWTEQETALAGYRRAVASLPSDSRILGFDTPEWEAGFVPIFAATWDLRGALDYTTHVNPPAAVTFSLGAACAKPGVTVSGVLVTRYVKPRSPLYAVSPRRDEAVRIDSQGSCERIVQRWGVSPFWGRTGTN
jgi:hypothetical protein